MIQIACIISLISIFNVSKVLQVGDQDISVDGHAGNIVSCKILLSWISSYGFVWYYLPEKDIFNAIIQFL